MKIAHVSDCYLPRLGGIERQVHDLAARQQAAGHQVEVITSVGASGRDADDLWLRVHRVGARTEPGAIHYRASMRGAALAADRDVDVVHVHLSTWSPLAFLAARAACRAGVPVAATVHSMWAGATPLMRASAATIGWRRWPIAWSAVSAAAARAVVTVIGNGPVSVLPNGVAADLWRMPACDRDPARIVIASVMRLAARKRPRQLLRIFAQVRRRVPRNIRTEAVIIGDGPLRHRLQADARRLGIAEWVSLTGTLPTAEIRARYRDCDIYVAPAVLESFGIAALEARAAGLPVVAHAGTGVAEFVTHGVHGLLVADDAAMVAALSELSTKTHFRATLTTNSRTHPPLIDWSGVLDGCDALYRRAAALRRPATTELAVEALA